MKHLLGFMRVTDLRDTSYKPSSLLYSSIHSFATSLLSVVIGMVSSIAIARGFGPAAKGSADLIMATGTLLAMVFGLSLQSGIVYVVARGRAIISGLLVRLALIALLQTALATVTLAGLMQTTLAPALMPLGSERWRVVAVALLVLCSLLAGHYRNVLIGLQEIPRVNIIDLYGKILTFSVIFALICASWLQDQQLTAEALVWAQVSGAMAVVFLLLWALRPWLTGSLQQESGLSEVITYSVPSYLANMVQFLNYRFDIFVVGYFVGVKGVGLYSLAVGIAQLLWLVSSAASQVLYPNVASSEDRVSVSQRTARMSRLSLWLSIFLSGGLASGGDMLLPLIFGTAFRESVPALMWLLPGVTIFSITNVIGSYFAGIGKPHLNFLASLIGLVVTIALDVVLIPSLGIVGAAIASSMSYLATTLAVVALFAREASISPMHALLVTRDDLSLIVATARRIRGEQHAS
ncbi:oligosaccharide flippase family protein [Chloroflexus aggregans]|uniref:Polysaccharide biosynthesis protein n=1 Tax=Chloroflexus aggregans (strain MD-66 / DSM 9485) TaxID=326427 RepID=B8GBP2_CHLAD|nr:polysaccharide biosynthesis C-terminal domain-containing protein [Chloroflexus aggregans]ACL24859.1 polysaccharide biosynthesis protein [Chloroflexus aggregans DSM 9485]